VSASSGSACIASQWLRAEALAQLCHFCHGAVGGHAGALLPRAVHAAPKPIPDALAHTTRVAIEKAACLPGWVGHLLPV
jgi:hypothetical protein